MNERTKAIPQVSPLDDELRQQLDGIRSEDTPDRLLELARRLQDLLRQRENPN